MPIALLGTNPGCLGLGTINSPPGYGLFTLEPLEGCPHSTHSPSLTGS